MWNELKSKVDRFLALADGNVVSRPWLVVILMHEYFRNLYPADPYIPFPKNVSHAMRISGVLDGCTAMLDAAEPAGSYFEHQQDAMNSVFSTLGLRDERRLAEKPTQQVYGKLWDKFDPDTYTKEARQIIAERFQNSDFDPSKLAGKTVLDMGCGSRRYAIGLAMTGAERVQGIDLGQQSIETAKDVARRAGLDNVEFRVGNVLELPYEGNAFDFVFCNGVLHHTEDMERGIRELFRVLKPGGNAFLYLYADGGLFWYSRKKMPPIMKRIPQEYSMAVLDLIGMPKNRFLFADNWYVPIERHTARRYLEDYLGEVGFSSIRKIHSGRTTDLDHPCIADDPDARLLWGDGEHRYLLTKP